MDRTVDAAFLQPTSTAAAAIVTIAANDDGTPPDNVTDPHPDFPGAWERSSDASPYAYTRTD